MISDTNAKVGIKTKLITPKFGSDASCSSSIKGKNDRIFNANNIKSTLDDFNTFTFIHLYQLLYEGKKPNFPYNA